MEAHTAVAAVLQPLLTRMARATSSAAAATSSAVAIVLSLRGLLLLLIQLLVVKLPLQVVTNRRSSRRLEMVMQQQ